MKHAIVFGMTFLIAAPALGSGADSTAVAANVAALPDEQFDYTHGVVTGGCVVADLGGGAYSSAYIGAIC